VTLLTEKGVLEMHKIEAAKAEAKLRRHFGGAIPQPEAETGIKTGYEIAQELPGSEVPKLDIGFRVYKLTGDCVSSWTPEQAFEEGVVQSYVKALNDIADIFRKFDGEFKRNRAYNSKHIHALMDAFLDGRYYLMAYGADQFLKYNGDKKNPKFKLSEQYKHERQVLKKRLADYAVELIREKVEGPKEAPE